MHFVPRAGSICKSANKDPVSSRKSKRLRWDKADLISYYYAGYQHEHGGIIDVVYQQIVQSLTSAAYEHCPQTFRRLFKEFLG